MPVQFDVDGEPYFLYMLGRYFGYSHYMNQLHPYSAAIYKNKSAGKAYGVFNEMFYGLYRAAIGAVKRNYRVDAVCSVPPRAGKEDRFKEITNQFAAEFGIINLSAEFRCIEDYPLQKSASVTEREENVKNVFSLGKHIDGVAVVIIDDIITTGATMRECIRELKAKGADVICIITLGINQLHGSYWSSNAAEVRCPVCSGRMRLWVNSSQRTFFYGCEDRDCQSTIDFSEGQNILKAVVNNEMKQ